MFLRTKSYIFIFGDVIVSCITASLGFKVAASNSKCRVCDVMVVSSQEPQYFFLGGGAQKKPRHNRVNTSSHSSTI